MIRGSAIVWLVLAAAAPAASQSLGDAFPVVDDPLHHVSGREVLERAFQNLYGVDLSQHVEIVTRKDGKVVRRHEVTQARKRIGGRAHSLLDYRLGNELYGLRSLRIEHRGGASYDRFLFLPQFQRVRRFTSAQRADLVLGTDLHLGDLEVNHADEFAVVGRSVEQRGDERVHRVRVEPFKDTGYSSVEIFIEPGSYAIREARYFRPGSETPGRTILAPAEEMVPFPGHLLPSHWVIEGEEEGVVTDVYFRRIRVNPEIPDTLFSARTLEATTKLPAFRD